MVQNLQFLRSTTPGGKPASLLAGQIAFNLTDEKLFVGNGSNFITNVLGVDTAGVTGKGFFTVDLSIFTALTAANSYTDTKVADLVNAAPALLNTLNELSAAIANDPNFVTTVAASVAAVQASVNAEITRATAAESALQTAVNTEVARATAAETQLGVDLAAEAVLARAAEATAVSAVDTEKGRAEVAEANLQADLNSEKSRAQSVESTLTADLATESARALAAEAVLTAADATELARATAAEAVLTADDATELARATAAETALDGRLDKIEENLNTQIVTIFDNNTATFPDAAAPIADPGYRDGWYFTNNTTGKKFNWYFFDGAANTSTIDTFSCYAIVTLDDVIKLPFFGIYTKPGASGNGGSWYRSRRVMYPDAPATLVAGKTYLMYFGVDPQVNPELPRITLKDEFNSVGPRLGNEEILTVGLNSDSSAGVNLYKVLVDSVGIKTVEGYDRKSLLRFRKPTLAEFNAGFDLGTF